MSTLCQTLGLALLIPAIGGGLASSVAGAQRQAGSHAEQTSSTGAVRRGITPAHRANVQARVTTATSIVNRLDAEARAAGRAAGWRQATLEALLALPRTALDRVEQNAHSLDALATALASVADDPSVIGDPNKDLTYTPFPPCRYIDTRNVGGKITAASPRGFDLSLSGPTYGGGGGCGLIDGVTAAIAMNVTIVDPSDAPGFLAVKPSLAAPTSSFLNWYEAGPHVQTANAGVLSVDQDVTGAEFFIQVSASVHVIVDFFGFFLEPEATKLETTVVSDTLIVPNGAGGFIESPLCPAGYAMTGGGCRTGHFGHHIETTAWEGNAWLCISVNTSGSSSSLRAQAVCSRVPGR